MKNKKINYSIFLQIIGIIFIFIMFIFCIFSFYKNIKNENIEKEKVFIIEQKNIINDNPFGLYTKPNYAYSNIPNDVLLNPYVAPLKDDRYFLDNSKYKVPINEKTNIGSIDTSYRQVGILTGSNNGKKIILPLMGRPLYKNNNKWNYYSQDEKNGIKLPIMHKRKSGTNDYGIDEIYNKDNVFVKGYNSHFNVELYDNNTIQYLPYI